MQNNKNVRKSCIKKKLIIIINKKKKNIRLLKVKAKNGRKVVTTFQGTI